MIRSLPQIDFVSEKLAALCRRWHISELAVFGSAARGEMRPDSDVDLMYEIEPDAPRGVSAYLDMKEEFEQFFGRPVDLVRKGTIANPFRKHAIKRDLTVVYAA